MARTEYEEEALRLYNTRASTHRAYASVRPIAPGPLAVTVTVNDVAIPISGVSSPGGTVLTLEDTPDGVVIAGAICRVGLPGWSGTDELGNYEHVAVYVQADVPPRVAITHRLTAAEPVAVMSTTHDPDFHYLLTATSGVGQWINDVGYLNTGKESFNDIIQETQGAGTMPGLTQGAGGTPWLTIILALLSFFASKKSGASNTKAALTAGLVGAGTYYTTHETDWGKANLGALDGVIATDGAPMLNGDGKPVLDASGQQIPSGSNPTGTTVGDVLKSWGASGTAAVIGTTGATAGTGVFSAKNLPWLIAGAVAVMIIIK